MAALPSAALPTVDPEPEAAETEPAPEPSGGKSSNNDPGPEEAAGLLARMAQTRECCSLSLFEPQHTALSRPPALVDRVTLRGCDGRR